VSNTNVVAALLDRRVGFDPFYFVSRIAAAAAEPGIRADMPGDLHLIGGSSANLDIARAGFNVEVDWTTYF